MKAALYVRKTANPFVILSAFVALALTAPASLADTGHFEGEIAMTIEERGTSEEIEMLVKDQKLRFEVDEGPTGRMTMIMNFEESRMFMIMPQERAYMEMEMPDMADQARADDDAELEETGEEQEILGYTAKKYIVTTADSEVEVWATDEVGGLHTLFIDEPPQPGQVEAGSPAERALREMNLMPLLMIERDATGREQTRTEMTKVEPRSIPDSEFEPPEDFQRLQMPMF